MGRGRGFVRQNKTDNGCTQCDTNQEAVPGPMAAGIRDQAEKENGGKSASKTGNRPAIQLACFDSHTTQ